MLQETFPFQPILNPYLKAKFQYTKPNFIVQYMVDIEWSCELYYMCQI